VYFDLPWTQVVVVAVACALSSTAISVKMYQDMGIAASSGARLALGIAIFQDIFVIFFLVLLLRDLFVVNQHEVTGTCRKSEQDEKSSEYFDHLHSLNRFI
jgi:predicted Kef-type K+ transport protein